MAAPLNTCTTIEQRGVVLFLRAKNMDVAKDIHKEMIAALSSFVVTHNDRLIVGLIVSPSFGLSLQ
jgi:hypothetical protein